MELENSVSFNIKLANVPIRIEAVSRYVWEYCKDYITDEQEVFSVHITRADIEAEKVGIAREYQKNGYGRCDISDNYAQTLAVYRKIVTVMPLYNILLFHGSAVAVDEEGYLFIARSGMGKSTHSRLWREYFGERAVMINDDKPLLQVTDDKVIVHGTPWDGEHRLSTNTSVTLKAICILTRSKDNYIEEVGAAEAYPMLLQQTYRTNDNQVMMRILDVLDRLLDNTRFYKLGCNMNIEAAKVAAEAMQKE